MSVGQIQNVMIADDQPDSRQMIKEHVEDANYKAVVQDKIGHLDNFFHIVKAENINAVIIDNHLKKTHYATFNGVDVVKKLFLELIIPVVLVSSFANADILDIQPYRQYIPVIINPSEMNPDVIIHGFNLSQNELNGIYIPERRPWRSLICVEEISEDKNYVYVVIPSWNLDEKVKIPVSMLPKDYLRNLRPDLHFFAQVNVDNEHYQDLYFRDFEPLKELKPKYAKLIHS